MFFVTIFTKVTQMFETFWAIWKKITIKKLIWLLFGQILGNFYFNNWPGFINLVIFYCTFCTAVASNTTLADLKVTNDLWFKIMAQVVSGWNQIKMFSGFGSFSCAAKFFALVNWIHRSGNAFDRNRTWAGPQDPGNQGDVPQMSWWKVRERVF